MPDLINSFFQVASTSGRRGDVEELLGDVASGLGFRSIVGFEFTSDQNSLVDMMDSDHERRRALRTLPSVSIVRRSAAVVSTLAERGRVTQFGVDDFQDDPSYIAAVRQIDMDAGTLVPIVIGNRSIGGVKFCGLPNIDGDRQLDLHAVAHMLFAFMRKTLAIGKTARLTPRESEILGLMAQGFTSPEIASAAGMSERTVNQHAENLAVKLHTRNRVHSVAEAMRLGLL